VSKYTYEELSKSLNQISNRLDFLVEKVVRTLKKEEVIMIGMGFGSFVVLFVAGLIAAAVVHYVARYRILQGFDGFLAKLITGWLGGWLGSPVLGHWFEPVKIAGVYIVPALLGAFALSFALTAAGKAVAEVSAPRIASEVNGSSDRLVA
jgi:uncharacterized membrane protein YeaQ/YmgE (transglycosylase-associated protein family)